MLLQHYFMIFTGTAIGGLIVMLSLLYRISAIKVDNKKAERIAKAIHDGAMTFLQEEYRLIAMVVPVKIIK